MKNFFENHIKYSKKSMLFAIVITTLFLVIMKSINRECSLLSEVTKWWLLADVILCCLTGIRVEMSEKYHRWFARILFIIAPFYGFCLIEWIMCNFPFQMTPTILVLNYILFFLIFAFLQVFINNVRCSLSIGMILCLVFGMANSFVGKFRGMMIRTADIYAVKTAMNVSESYEFIFDWYMVIGILMTVAFVLICVRCEYNEKSLKRRMIKSGLVITSIVVFGLVVFNRGFLTKHNVRPDSWGEWQSIKDHGSLWDVVAGIPFLWIEEPENYSQEEVEKILQSDTVIDSSELQSNNDFGGQVPNIIMIMNESFVDLEAFGSGFTAEEELLPFFNTLKEDVIKGEVVVPTYGGGTCNTEFESITGCTTAFLPDGALPFMSYVKKDMENLGNVLKNHEAIFAHPFKSTGWNRQNVYSLFGFEDVYFEEDYDGVEELRGYVSDFGNYKKIVEYYESTYESGKNIFLFNVTMQNHGGYETENFDGTSIVGKEGVYPMAEEYLTLIKKSDEAFQWLLEYFEEREEPVIVCMFGDHYPSVEEELYAELLENYTCSETEKDMLRYRTPFLIWSNYDIEEKEGLILSTNYLPVLLLETAELPLTSYQNYLLKLYNEWPVVSEYGLLDSSGMWYDWESVEDNQKLKEYKKIQYYSFFEN